MEHGSSTGSGLVMAATFSMNTTGSDKDGQLWVIRTNESWGDYWTVIIGGLTAYLPRHEGRLRLLRTGPFVPPIAVSGMSDLVVTEAMRDYLKMTKGVVGFLPVVKERIVRLDWSDWPLDGGAVQLVRFREPEDTVVSGEHDQMLSREIGEMYEVLLEEDGAIEEDFDENGEPIARLLELPKKELHLFRATDVGGYGSVVASPQFVTALAPDVTRWLQFTPVA